MNITLLIKIFLNTMETPKFDVLVISMEYQLDKIGSFLIRLKKPWSTLIIAVESL